MVRHHADVSNIVNMKLDENQKNSARVAKNVPLAPTESLRHSPNPNILMNLCATLIIRNGRFFDVFNFAQ